MKNTFPWQMLLDWYKKNGKHDFPWRDYTKNDKWWIINYEWIKIDNSSIGYRVWLAEILLQQTQADRVVPFYTRILERYPSIHDLARADYDEFFPYYQWLGYYSRARNLLKTAKIVSEEYRWVFPRDKMKLRKLPGVGEYTARAILAFGYTEPLLAWDTNLETIFSRYYKWAKNIKLTQEEKDQIEKDFQDFIKVQKQWNGSSNWLQAMNSTGFGERNCLSQIENSTKIAKDPYPKGISNATRSQRGSFSLPNSFGTFSTKSTENISKKENIEKDLSSSTDTGLCRDDKKLVRNINNALMDWARLMEPKTSSQLNKETYIFRNSEFYITWWENELIEKKKTEYFPIPDAKIIVTLHQDHKIYYSLSDELYSPFVLPPSEDRDTRKYVQEYFRSSYWLELSVRPIHQKWITEDGKPYIAINAQIQSWKYEFHIFTKKAKELQEKKK